MMIFFLEGIVRAVVRIYLSIRVKGVGLPGILRAGSWVRGVFGGILSYLQAELGPCLGSIRAYSGLSHVHRRSPLRKVVSHHS